MGWAEMVKCVSQEALSVFPLNFSLCSVFFDACMFLLTLLSLFIF